MDISSTKISFHSGHKAKAVSTPGPAKAEPAPSNAEADGVFLSHPRKALLGAALGGGALGLALGAAGGSTWGLAGLALGAVAGGLLGEHSPQLTYDAKATVQYLRERRDAGARAASYDEQAGALRPLLDGARIAHDSSGDVKRRFDGYDSSRNLTGLLSEEGEADSPYRFALEFAHLRPNAQGDFLRSTLELKSGENALRLDILGDDEVLANGRKLTSEAKSKHSVRYNQLIVELDKGLLRELGWSDGKPLEVKASTTSGEKEFDSVVATTESAPGESLFRWEGKTIYQIMTDRFHNADSTNDQGVDPDHPNRFHGGDWQGVIDKLDYIEELGADCIWLSCPYENDRDFFGTDGYHGYWPHDFQKAEPSFGSKEKLKELVEKAHERGLKVLLDVVVNHTGYNSPKVRDPEFRDWFHREGSRNPLSQYYLERGSLAGLPDLAQENPDVSRYLIDCHKMWLEETNVDGYRVDAIRHVPPSFLREFDTEMKEGRDNFITVGEVFWNDPHYLAGYQNQTQDTLFDFPLMQAVRDVFGGNPDLSLGDRWKQFQQTKEHNFGQAIMDLTKPGGSSMKKLSEVFEKDYAYDNPRLLSTILDNHDTGRFLSHAGENKDKLKLASAFLFACRGTPSLYYGTETGMSGQMGGNREDMTFDTAPELQQHFKKLVNLRKMSKPLQLGTQQELLVKDDVYAFSRVLPGNEVLCAFNNGSEVQSVSIPLGATQIPDGAKLASLLDDRSFQVKDGALEVELPPGDFAYLEWRSENYQPSE
jgi:alpha-amylase